MGEFLIDGIGHRPSTRSARKNTQKHTRRSRPGKSRQTARQKQIGISILITLILSGLSPIEFATRANTSHKVKMQKNIHSG